MHMYANATRKFHDGRCMWQGKMHKSCYCGQLINQVRMQKYTAWVLHTYTYIRNTYVVYICTHTMLESLTKIHSLLLGTWQSAEDDLHVLNRALSDTFGSEKHIYMNTCLHTALPTLIGLTVAGFRCLIFSWVGDLSGCSMDSSTDSESSSAVLPVPPPCVISASCCTCKSNTKSKRIKQCPMQFNFM